MEQPLPQPMGIKMETAYLSIMKELKEATETLLDGAGLDGGAEVGGDVVLDPPITELSEMRRELIRIKKEHVEKEEAWQQLKIQMEGEGQRFVLALETKEAELKESEEARKVQLAQKTQLFMTYVEKMKTEAEADKEIREGDFTRQLQHMERELEKSYKSGHVKDLALKKMADDNQKANLALEQKLKDMEQQNQQVMEELNGKNLTIDKMSSEIAKLRADLQASQTSQLELKSQAQALSSTNGQQLAEIEQLKAKLDQEKQDGEQRRGEVVEELRKKDQVLETVRRAVDGERAGSATPHGQGQLGSPTKHGKDPKRPLHCLCMKKEEGFPDAKSLLCHIAHPDRPVKRVPCPICPNKTWATNQSLAYHLKKVHTVPSTWSGSSASKRRRVETPIVGVNGNGNASGPMPTPARQPEDNLKDTASSSISATCPGTSGNTDADREATRDNEEEKLNDYEDMDLSEIWVGDAEFAN